MSTIPPRRFVVQVSYGRMVSTMAEVDMPDTCLTTIVRDIARGQYERVIAVWELVPASREIARAVADHAIANDLAISDDLRGFLQIYDDRMAWADPPADPEYEWEPPFPYPPEEPMP